jgi:hypothetical protein
MAMLLASVAANGQDAPVPPGGEPTCVALARGLWVDVSAFRSGRYSDQAGEGVRACARAVSVIRSENDGITRQLTTSSRM